MLSAIKAFFRLVRRLFQAPILLARSTRVAWSSRIGSGGILTHSIVGKYTVISGGVYLSKTRVGNYCSVASGSKLGGAEHPWWWGSTSLRLAENFDKFELDKETILEDDVWLGSNVVVRQGVRIGRGAVVGANSVVLHDVPAYTLVAGVPAREIRKRFPEEIVRSLEASRFWEFPPHQAKALLNAIQYPVRPGH